MPSEEALIEFLTTYRAARRTGDRLATIQHFRAREPHLPENVNPETLRAVMEELLRRARRDAMDGRFAAARLLGDLWRGFAHAAADDFFWAMSMQLIEGCAVLQRAERELLWDAVGDALQSAGPLATEAVCRELLARETKRCRPEVRGNAHRYGQVAVMPAFEGVKLVVHRAPAEAWPRLARDLWSLYLPAALHADAREDLRFWIDLASEIFRRTLLEAHSSDLHDASPSFFSALAARGHRWIGEERLRRLVPAMTVWSMPPVIKVLEHWSEPRSGFTPAFRENARMTAESMRAALGLSSEVVPAAAPQGDGTEPAPAAAPRGGDSEPVPGPTP